MKKNSKQDKRKFTRELIELFAPSFICDVQHLNCPANMLKIYILIINSMKTSIAWLILLGLRGDYHQDSIIQSVKKELQK